MARPSEARWLRIKASPQVISELQATQSERFGEASGDDPYYGSLRHEMGSAWLEVRADELASVADIWRVGASYQRQRRAAEEHDGDLRAVVDALVGELDI